VSPQLWRSRDNHEGIDYLIVGAADASEATDTMLRHGFGIEPDNAHPDDLLDFEAPQAVVHWWEIVPLFEPPVIARKSITGAVARNPDAVSLWSCVPLRALDLTGKIPALDGTRGVCFDGEYVAIEHYNIVGPFDEALDGAMHGWDWCVDLEHPQGLSWALARVGRVVEGGPVYALVRDLTGDLVYGIERLTGSTLERLAIAMFELEGGVVLRVEPQERSSAGRATTGTQDGPQPRQEPQDGPQEPQDPQA